MRVALQKGQSDAKISEPLLGLMQTSSCMCTPILQVRLWMIAMAL